ncbi:hypothetical protein [Pontiella sp.]|uniref:hypothetical protein n=1 Tax=Pontiella sp. TaxID=2837462 RepID=UPI003561CD25
MKNSDARNGIQIGLWIDHKVAILVFMEKGSARVERIESGAESHYHSSGGSRSAGGLGIAQDVSNEQRMDERRKHEYHRFYRKVIEAVAPADALLILGPGEAKRELAKEIQAVKSFGDKPVAVETSDKLSENQLVAKVKAFFVR